MGRGLGRAAAEGCVGSCIGRVGFQRGSGVETAHVVYKKVPFRCMLAIPIFMFWGCSIVQHRLSFRNEASYFVLSIQFSRVRWLYGSRTLLLASRSHHRCRGEATRGILQTIL